MRYNSFIKQSRVAPERAVISTALTAMQMDIGVRINALAMQARFYYLQTFAHRMVTQALRHGDLIKPCICEQCGNTNDVLDAHHLDYSKPLEVIWLCRSCHLATHGTKDKVHTKTYKAAQIVECYLKDHPEALNWNGVELARLLGVGKSTVYNVFKSIKSLTPSF